MSNALEEVKGTLARGNAATARVYGAATGAQGFEKGGEKRRKANQIVHLPPGQGRFALDASKALLRDAMSSGA